MSISSVYNNVLSGTLPSFPCNLTRLTTLYLQNNSFSGFIPSSYCDLALSTATQLQIYVNDVFSCSDFGVAIDSYLPNQILSDCFFKNCSVSSIISMDTLFSNCFLEICKGSISINGCSSSCTLILPTPTPTPLYFSASGVLLNVLLLLVLIILIISLLFLIELSHLKADRHKNSHKFHATVEQLFTTSYEVNFCLRGEYNDIKVRQPGCSKFSQKPYLSISENLAMRNRSSLKGFEPQRTKDQPTTQKSPTDTMDSDLELTRLRLLEQLDDPESLLDDHGTTELHLPSFSASDNFKLRENEATLTLKYANLSVCAPDAKNPTGLKDANPNAPSLSSLHIFVGNIAKASADEIIDLIVKTWPEIQGTPSGQPSMTKMH